MSRRFLTTAVLGLSAALCGASVYARDFGVQGQVWPIIEQDMRELLVASAARVDWEKTQAQTKENAKRFLDNLPKRAMPSTAEYQFRWFDPSVVLPQDIQAPVRQADGSFRWQTMAARGTRVNPLQHVQPTTALFFYDGADSQQMRLVTDLSRRAADYFVFIEAGRGSLRQASEAVGRPIFHASDALISRFDIRALPTLVFPGRGEAAGFLGMATFAPPYAEATVRQLWPIAGAQSAPAQTLNSRGGASSPSGANSSVSRGSRP